jgi:hypothetical protein
MTREPVARASRLGAWPDPGPARRARALLLGLMATTASAVIAVPCLLRALRAFTALRPLTAVSPDEALVVLAAALAGLVCLWLSLLFALGTCSLLPGLLGAGGRRLTEHLAPAFCARLTSSLLGAALLTSTPPAALAIASTAGTVAAKAVAADASGGRPNGQTSGAAAGAADLSRQAPEPGWRPHRPAAAPAHDLGSRLLATSPRPGWCAGTEDGAAVVRRGDSLWTIAARHLGPEATAAEVAHEWPRWYAANRHLIGDNPGLILPGQVLVAPDESIPRDAGNTADAGNTGDAADACQAGAGGAPGKTAHPGQRLGARQ